MFDSKNLKKITMTFSLISSKLIRLVFLWSLVLGTIASSCSKDDAPPAVVADKTTLNAKIALSQTAHDETVEGSKPGQYEAGSKAALTAALTAAKAVSSDPAATQAQVNNAAANLQAALEAYLRHLIKEIAAENLIGFWKMNGNANDSSGNGNDGVITTGAAYYGGGTLTPTADRFGRAGMAYFFDKGANIEVPYTTSLNPSEITISLWSKKSSVVRALNADTYTLVSLNRWNGYKLQYQSANKIFMTVKAVNGTDTAYYDRDDEVAVLDNDVWYHVVVTFKPGTMNFYLDGDLVKSWTNTPNPPITLASPINFIIGQDLPTDKYLNVDGDYQVAWGGFFTGDIDDVMFYNIALDGPQVKSINTNQKTL
jgi:hypothetical protein